LSAVRFAFTCSWLKSISIATTLGHFQMRANSPLSQQPAAKSQQRVSQEESDFLLLNKLK